MRSQARLVCEQQLEPALPLLPLEVLPLEQLEPALPPLEQQLEPALPPLDHLLHLEHLCLPLPFVLAWLWLPSRFGAGLAKEVSKAAEALSFW